MCLFVDNTFKISYNIDMDKTYMDIQTTMGIINMKVDIVIIENNDVIDEKTVLGEIKNIEIIENNGVTEIRIIKK